MCRPQTDVKLIGPCKFWIQNIDLVKHSHKPPPNFPPDAATHAPPLALPLTDSKCVGMMTPRHFFISSTRHYTQPKHLALHNSICPPPTSFASELTEILACKTKLENKYQKKESKDSTIRGRSHPTFTTPSSNGHMLSKRNGLSLGIKHSKPKLTPLSPHDLLFSAQTLIQNFGNYHLPPHL